MINANFRSTVKPDIKKVCDQNWNSTADQDLCYRVLEAARTSCTAFSGYSVGLRPACWYKVRL